VQVVQSHYLKKKEKVRPIKDFFSFSKASWNTQSVLNASLATYKFIQIFFF